MSCRKNSLDGTDESRARLAIHRAKHSIEPEWSSSCGKRGFSSSANSPEEAALSKPMALIFPSDS